MAKRSRALLHGTLEALGRSRCHGYGIARWIEQSTDEVVQVEEGSLYPALYRMEKKG
ncbi:MAG: helix-turn-helix transcriptional regulator [Acidobacteriota bacterium]